MRQLMTMYPAPRSSPGRMPATNRSAMEVPVTTPYMMKEMLGGMIGPTVPAKQISVVL